MNDRINELKKLLKEDPEDTFLLYALGLEFIKNSNLKLALEYFEILLNKFPEYLPVYYQAAHLYLEMDDPQKAIKTFENGMDLAKRLDEIKTYQELANAYNNFLHEMDE